MFDGKMKALTFSYDDGVTQDQRLIDIFNKYGLKCTFNINSGFLGKAGMLVRENVTVAHTKPRASEVRAIYQGHEIAVHGVTHPNLKHKTDREVVKQVEEDRLRLSDIAGYEVVGMAYPGGTGCMDDRVVSLIDEYTGVLYARTTTQTHNFEPQKGDYLKYNYSVYHHGEWDIMEKLATEFVEVKADTLKIFSIWGHAYEFDIRRDWDRFEEICKYLSNRDDIYYATNKDIFLDKDLLSYNGTKLNYEHKKYKCGVARLLDKIAGK